MTGSSRSVEEAALKRELSMLPKQASYPMVYESMAADARGSGNPAGTLPAPITGAQGMCAVLAPPARVGSAFHLGQNARRTGAWIVGVRPPVTSVARSLSARRLVMAAARRGLRLVRDAHRPCRFAGERRNTPVAQESRGRVANRREPPAILFRRC